MVTQICAQCNVEKDIDLFRKVTNQYTGVHPMSICKECYRANQEETRRRMEEARSARQATRHAGPRPELVDREAIEQEKQRREARARDLSRLSGQVCPRCHQPRIDGELWVFSDEREHLHFSRYCADCTNSTSHAHYVLYCPLLGVVRYTGITCQPLKKRLAGHLRGDSGTERKRAWIEDLRAQGLAPCIEQIDESPNEKVAKEKEQQWIDHYLALGCPLTNGEAQDIQRVLDVQSGRVATTSEGIYGSEVWEYWRRVKTSAQSFRWECSASRQLEVKRWHNRSQHAYFLDTTYNQWFPHHHYAEKAREYPQTIFEHRLPTGRADRRAALAPITIAYIYWREPDALTTRQAEDIQFLLKNRIPVIGDTIDPAWHSISGQVISLSARRPLLHPFHYTMPPERTLTLWV